ncbi:MAG: HAD hydrolase-like protein [Oscillospiraceae bacterium]|nr:HAD hydrolase-like protein [Oscillospiraceae bacterium]
MKYPFDTVLFDLDGTLLDSQGGILSCIQEALRHFGIEREKETLYRYLGPPIQDTFREFFSDEKKVEEATGLYRALYREKGIYDARVYPGIPELLKALGEAEIYCRVATSKPEVIAVDVLTHFKLAGFFDSICGVPLGRDGVTKADVIKTALQKGGRQETAVMVGDRMYDLNGAAACGIPAIGAAYGYGPLEELSACGPLYICQTPTELGVYLLHEQRRNDFEQHGT